MIKGARDINIISNGFIRKYIFFIGVVTLLGACSLGKLSQDAGVLVPVLMYHEIVTDESRITGEAVIRLNSFKEQMQYLYKNNYTTLTMDELLNFMQRRLDIPEKSVVLNFDDGWKNALNAIPILQKYNMKASFWVITDTIENPEKYAGLYMTQVDLLSIKNEQNFEIGSHTVTHPWNPESNLVTWIKGKPEGKNIQSSYDELTDSKTYLESLLKLKITKLAWPCGWYDKKLVEMAKNIGYTALLTTNNRANAAGDDVFYVNRTFVDGSCDLETFIKTLQRGQQFYCS